MRPGAVDVTPINVWCQLPPVGVVVALSQHGSIGQLESKLRAVRGLMGKIGQCLGLRKTAGGEPKHGYSKCKSPGQDSPLSEVIIHNKRKLLVTPFRAAATLFADQEFNAGNSLWGVTAKRRQPRNQVQEFCVNGASLSIGFRRAKCKN